MRKFPDQMIQATEDPVFWPEAKRLLNVTSAADIDDTIFAGLQTEIDKRLKMPLPHVPSATQSYPAQLSVGRRSPTSTLRFNKFSVPGPLLGIYEKQRKKAQDDSGSRLDIMLNCIVEKLTADDDGVVRAVKTSRGTISWQGDNTKVILCAGVSILSLPSLSRAYRMHQAFPAATILLNSFPSCAGTVGKRVTGHFLTHIVARVPISDFGRWSLHVAKSHQFSRLEIAAHYLAGMHPKTKQQYHVQITAIHSPDPEQDAEDAARECPDYAAAATADQLKDSTKHVVFVCATLGEFTEDNPDNWFKPDPNNSDITTNMKLQYTIVEQDRQLWDLMDKATYETIEVMSTPPNLQPSEGLEYWHSKKTGQAGFWAKKRPEVSDIRVPGIVHEASTAYMGDKATGGSVDELGRPHGISNVCVTGGALFPTAGSWNPTLTMCGFAQHLARKLQPEVSLPVRQS